MKILFPVIRAFSGADNFFLRLSSALNKRGIEARIEWFDSKYEFAPFLLRKKQIPNDVDIIHANSGNGFVFKRKNIPLIVTEFHCVFDQSLQSYKTFLQRIYHNLFVRQFEIASFKSADVVTVISSYTQKSVASVYGVTNTKKAYVWVDKEKFKPLKNDTPFKSRSVFRLLFVGNLSRRKGADLLPQIMKKLGDGFELRFTGGLRNRNGSDFPPNMIPLGKLSEGELIKEYQECDALLFPSRFEGFGYAPLEAMSCGKPVVATNATSIPEVVENNVSGILCPLDDVDAFVIACKELSSNRELCMKMGMAGRERAENEFSEEKIINQYMNIYEDVVNKIGGEK